MPANQPIQIIAYIRRHPTLTPSQFYTHWKDNHAPIIHTSGHILPNNSNNTPNANTTTTPVAFDGIAIFVVPSMQHLSTAFADPYFAAVIQVDEERFLDYGGEYGSVVARFEGPVHDVVVGGRAVEGLEKSVGGEGVGEF
ncbi:hypothetical protein P280DRAFT_482278 [Massarina eburnea CBS 473.64]|uniref:EthD domain-containing protein n=1 Tax=Massarina eburnea CBS 473.64 TaxID=1395130 RepID=A0A6A6RTS4_9PLEO|nr:hypothetical protein P280DRAFT_482278 [Massarina eburnea CBS 473.64]